MRFSRDLEKRILEEIENVPNVRYIAKKFSIHPSTFYRWRGAHPEFDKKIRIALELGRNTITDAAEGTIIKGVLKGEYKPATFWLQHNKKEYMGREKAAQRSIVEQAYIQRLDTPVRDGTSQFEEMYKGFLELEDSVGYDKAKEFMDNLFAPLWERNPELKEIFYSTYPAWLETYLEKIGLELMKAELEIQKKYLESKDTNRGS